MSSVARTAILITLIALLSKGFGFVRDIAMAASYGTTMHSDAYLMAQAIVGLVSGLILSAVGTTFTPVLADYMAQRSNTQTRQFINVVYTITAVGTFVLAVFGFVFAETLVSLFAPRFSEEASALTITLTQMMIPSLLLTAFLTLNSALLQNHGHYLVPAAIGLPMNIMLITTMLLFTEDFGIYGLAAAFVIGSLLQLVMQWPFVRKLGYRITCSLKWNEAGVRQIGLLLVPIMIGSGIQQINVWIDRVLSSGLPEGSVAALNYAGRLSFFIIGLLSATVASIYYTALSQFFAAGDHPAFKNLLKTMINVSHLLIIPASAGLILLREPIVQAVYERGMFDERASAMTALALLCFSIGLAGFLLRDVLNRAFYALKDTKTTLINSAIAIVGNIVLSLLLVGPMGLGGLALATSLASVIGTLLLFRSLYRKIGDFGIRHIGITLLKVWLATGVMSVFVLLCFPLLRAAIPAATLALAACIFIGAVSYVLILWLLKVEELSVLQQRLWHKIRLGK